MNKLSHIAIIMDGNGRWALRKKKNRTFGHKMGLNNIKNLIKTCQNNNVKFLTLFVFSFDNWNRSKSEIGYLFALLKNFLKKDIQYLIENKIRIKVIGEKKKLDPELIKSLKNIEKVTYKYSNTTVNLAFNYSSKLEIINSINKCIKQKKEINITNLKKNLYTGDIPDPEILIRTGYHKRLSDFLLWQISYTELFFIKKLWPDFKSNDLTRIINIYKKIKRNFGSIDE